MTTLDPWLGLLKRADRSGQPRAMTLLALVLLVGPAAAAAASPQVLPTYPANPFSTDDLICATDRGVHCLERDTLAPSWTALEDHHTLEPVIAEERVLVGTSRGVYAFGTESGELLWHFRTQGLAFSPTVAGQTAYTSDEHGDFVALDVKTGEPRWERSFRGWTYPPAVVGEVLVTGGRSGILRGIDPESGKTRWRRDLGSELVYRPSAAGQHALAATFDGRVLAITDAGRMTWQARDPVASMPPAVADGRALFAGMDGVIRARSLEDGELLWQWEIGSKLRAAPRIDGDRLAAIDSDGRAAVVRLDSGNPELVAATPTAVVGTPLPTRDKRWIVLYRKSGDGGLGRRFLGDARSTSGAGTSNPPHGPLRLGQGTDPKAPERPEPRVEPIPPVQAPASIDSHAKEDS